MSSFFHKYIMIFNFLRKKRKEEPRTFEGRFVTDDEIREMTRPKKGTFIRKEFKEIREMMDGIKKYVD